MITDRTLDRSPKLYARHVDLIAFHSRGRTARDVYAHYVNLSALGSRGRTARDGAEMHATVQKGAEGCRRVQKGA